MKAIKKVFSKTPSSLTDDIRKDAFDKNREAKKYVVGNLYKTKEVSVALNNILKKTSYLHTYTYAYILSKQGFIDQFAFVITL